MNRSLQTTEVYQNFVRSAQEQARVFMMEHKFNYKGEEVPFAYSGDFPETGSGRQEKFGPEKRCWIKNSYFNDGEGLRITFNAHDGYGRSNISKEFRANEEALASLSDEERDTLRKSHEAGRKAARERAEKENLIDDDLANRASNRFSCVANNRPPKDAITYFSKKGLNNPYDILHLHWECDRDYTTEEPIEKWIALVALRNGKGELRALQELFPSTTAVRPRDKNYVGKTGSLFYTHGKIENGKDILVTEGVATAVSVFLATNITAVASMDIGNLPKVVKDLSVRYPQSSITICCDNDHHRETEGKGNPGLDMARKTAKRHDCKLAIPEFPVGQWFDRSGKARTDFDDLRQLNGNDVVKQQLERATFPEKIAEEGVDDAIPEFVAEFNRRHAVVHQGQTYILTEKRDPTLERDIYSLEPVSSFNAWHKPLKSDDGKKQLSAAWLEHPQRREYFGGIVFDPRHNGHFDDCYNLFQGFPVKPVKGNCDLFWQLVDVLAGCSKDAVNYIRKWLAHMIQKPWELPEVAIAFRGLQGTGKGEFFGCIKKLVCPHSVELASMEKVVGRFNGHLKDVILVYANEAVWGRHKSDVGVLKAMITDKTQAIEQKGIDLFEVRNCKRLVFSSNENWIVPMDIDDRRFLVVDIDPKLKENFKFFSDLEKQMKSGGLEALMHDLFHEDIADWHPRQKPRSIGAFDLKLRSLKTPHRWLYECLRQGRCNVGVPDAIHLWDESLTERQKDLLHQDYIYYCNARLALKHVDPPTVFWRDIFQILGKLPERRLSGDGRPRVIELPPLSKARLAFEKYSKEDSAGLWEE